MSEVKGLGRGLSDLGVSALLSNLDQNAAKKNVQDIHVSQLIPGRFQPRQIFNEDSLCELAESIERYGILQPLLVSPIDNNQYEIIAGERRFQAAQKAGLSMVPCLVKTFSEQDSAAIALIENIQRENLNPIDEAEAINALIDQHQMTHQVIAKVLGKSRSTITNAVRLLQLCDGVKTLLKQKDIDMGHARALLSLDAKDQQRFANNIIQQKWSVRETERMVQQFHQPKSVNPKDKKQEADLINKITQEWSKRLNKKLNIKHKPSGHGMLQVPYESLGELQILLNAMKDDT